MSDSLFSPKKRAPRTRKPKEAVPNEVQSRSMKTTRFENDVHNARAFHNPTWTETDETRKVERDYRAEANCRAYLSARTAAYRAGKEAEFLAAHPAETSSSFEP
jgi:hypothetical protein